MSIAPPPKSVRQPKEGEKRCTRCTCIKKIERFPTYYNGKPRPTCLECYRQREQAERAKKAATVKAPRGEFDESLLLKTWPIGKLPKRIVPTKVIELESDT